LLPATVLIVSDDPEFARTLASRWQAERHVPEITIATSSVWHPATGAHHDLIIVGPLRGTNAGALLSTVNSRPRMAEIVFVEAERDFEKLRAECPQALVVRRSDGWAGTLVLLAIETLRRVQATQRAQRAEALALAEQGHASLGRYMLETRPSVSNALTSILGNADLLLLAPRQGTAESREQLEAIHNMALRLNEIMQRFSSLAAEMRVGEKESQAETQLPACTLATRS